ncbi:DUF3592 domain-containing protein [Gelidibacter gilvus]|uniref:DUF3592 domain-containing protein n=1 Tax=Gelidibacter gilvus TaxID=59602 RepID=A0A4Q0XDA7_9FLAO|nr:DUF3592 domain-containing protein [Gelidibacter gilvus]RXJ43795.1 DUF3592 domain-containing protein [Gelidibacter gilvus]
MEHFTFIDQKIDILGLIALVVATPFFIFFVRNVMLSKASKNWPKVNGTIINIPNMPTVRKYSMEYEYEVGGTTYRNRRVFYSNIDAYSISLAIEFDKKYSKHQIVDVFYNPKKPKQAVLEPGRIDGAFLGVALLGMVVIYGVFAVFAPTLYAQFIDLLFQIFN